MKVDFINRECRNRRLILIFSGWGTDCEAYRDVFRSGWDVAVCHDYSNLEFPREILCGYETIYLYAWSLGVSVAQSVFPAERVTKAFALNGTPYPAHDDFGIPTAIYNVTHDNLDERNLLKFRIRMFGGRSEMSRFSNLLPLHDDISLLKQALVKVKADSESRGDSSLKWDAVYLSGKDAIFPPDSMKRYWEGKSRIISMSEAGHFIPMKQIIDYTLPDTEVVKRQFAIARRSYDSQASAQQTIARKLAAEYITHEARRVLEIGPGTGFFTREYTGKIHPEEITFVDLSIPDPFHCVPTEHYVEADAESWIAAATGKWDLIVSSSAVQWFSDLRQFLYHCKEHLNPGGRIVISGFAEGTLSEFDSLRPNPLSYPSVEEVRGYVKEIFGGGTVYDEDLRIEFPGPREALLHLKSTGVSATHQSLPGTFTLRQLSAHIPRTATGQACLTYRPLYIIAGIY